MPRIIKLLFGVFLTCQLLLAGSAFAAPEIDAAIEGVQENIAELESSSLSDIEKRDLQDLYQQTLAFLQRSQAQAREQAELREQIAQAPEHIRTARQQLDRLGTLDPEKIRSRYASQELEDLERLLGEKVGDMFGAQNQLTAVNSELIAAQTRPERTQASVSSNQQREHAINEQIRNLQRQSDSALNQARLSMLKAESQSLQIASDLLRQKLAANGVLQDVAAQQRSLLSQQIADVEVETQILQDVINEKRRSESEQTVSEATSQALQAGNHDLLRQQGTLNRELSEELLRATTQVGELTGMVIQTKQQIDSLLQIESALEQQIGVLEGSVLLSRILHQQKKSLPKVRYDATLADQIADLRLRQFELNQLREQMANRPAYLERLVNRLPEDQQQALRGEFETVVSSRASLVEQLGNNINSLLTLGISLQINQRQLQQLSGDLRQTIDDQLFWVASNRTLDRAWFASFPRQAAAQWEDIEPLDQLQRLYETLRSQIVWIGLLIIVLGLYTWRLPHLRQQLRSLHEDVGHFRRDSVGHTPRALLLTALMVVPVPLVLSGIGFLLSTGDEPAMPELGQGLSQMALAWFILHMLYRVLDPHGIATRHFRWEPELVGRLHRLARRAAWVVLPLVLVIAVAEIRPEKLSEDVLGRLFMLVGMLVLAYLLGKVMQRSKPLYNSKFLHLMAALVLTLVPLILAGLVAWGFHYTAIKLADRFIGTLYLITIWMLLEGTVVRYLGVAGRRLAYQRALTKRQATQRDAQHDSEPGAEVPEMDIQQINQQSLRLARLGLLVLFGVLVYLTWADLLSATSYLESVSLWEYNSGTAENPQMAPISAGDVLGALVIIALTFTLGRNLPGLLEIMVLSRIQLGQGSSYAITTLLSYVIVSLGIFYALSALGVSWNKLQWLVAALGVGLGFGLQEIFANFVSGLIILFERPVRIGDVVTIGPLSGTVNRIRIRATTITDFDRKEIIVPNKTFVTEQLINWSLNDTITRVTISVGISYGSDLAKAKELLMNIATANPRVLQDPEPLVLFLSFGESTLGHELRIHVRELLDRNMAIDEINREIDQQFRQHNIGIAFRQLDVNLRNTEGLERLVASRHFNGDQPVSPTSARSSDAQPMNNFPDQGSTAPGATEPDANAPDDNPRKLD
ncbi:hypothetical protein LCGC14_0178930 [marine sediment metagenome]